uniref:rRNA-processing protein EFG1 n=1 Tax=Zea mays TaxID=4577 RepID=A0A804LT97_MAIZE
MLFSYCSMFNFQDLPDEIRVAQEKKLEELKRQQELQNQLVVQRTLQFRDRKIKFFERRKIERMIRRLEKQQRSNGDGVNNNLSKLREDLEYVRVSFLHYCPAHDDMTYKYHYNFVFCDVSFSLH